MVSKITLVGKPGVGKTTIKKVIFEGENPNKLILFPLEATIGTKFSIHDFIDAKISLVDTPGQSLPILLEDEEKQIQIFENSNAIIYIFDYTIWINQSREIIDEIKKIYSIIKNKNYNTKIFLFLHKIDLISQKIRGKIKLLKEQVINLLNLPIELTLYFTSLHPDMIYSIYNAFSEIISNFSESALNLKDLTNHIIANLSRTICFITDKNSNIIIQANTQDFDNNLVPNLHKKVYNLSKTSGEGNFSLIDSRSKVLYMMRENISYLSPHFQSVLFLSETLGKNDLMDLIDKFKVELKNNYNIN
ncbi:MAG: GTPase [Promethearchaeota archaeon]